MSTEADDHPSLGEDGQRYDDESAPVPSSRHSRPSAPAFFLPKSDSQSSSDILEEFPPVVEAVGRSEDPPSSGPLDLDSRCAVCGTQSPKGYRFCVSCGSELVAASASVLPDSQGGPTRDARIDSEPGDSGHTLRPGPVSDQVPREALKLDLGSEPPPRQLASSGRAARLPGDVGAGQVGAEGASGPSLVVIVEDGSEGKSFELQGEQVDLGRLEGEIVLAEDRYLSPRHARLFLHEDSWYLRDLNSTNGVYRRLRQAEPLKHRDLVLMGLEVLQFELVEHSERGLGHAIQQGTLVFGSPSASRRARLCQRTVEGVVRDCYYLVSDETTIGREIGDIVFTADPFMSRRHASMRWREATQDYILTDLNSSNGTFLAIRDDVRLENGDFIRVGQHLFRVDLPDSLGKPH